MPIPRKVVSEPAHTARVGRPARLDVSATGTREPQPLFTLVRESETPRGRAKYETVYIYPEMFDELFNWMVEQRQNWPPPEER